jgi:type III restriction enzyme
VALKNTDDQSPPLDLIVEVTEEKKKDKKAKVSTARTLWVPAMNNHGEFGRWVFIEITDPWDAQNTIRRFLSSAAAAPQPVDDMSHMTYTPRQGRTA